MVNYYQMKRLKAQEKQNKERWLKLDPTIPESSGIYILTREENGFKYAYIGQAKHILTRLAEHLKGFQHIDLSIKNHKLYSKSNPCGWKIEYIRYKESELDDKEQYFIKMYANAGYQMRNKTAGGQSDGKFAIANGRDAKGYYDGVKYGEKKTLLKVKEFFDKYLDYSIKEPIGKVKQRKFEQFKQLLDVKVEDSGEESKGE